MPGGVYVARGSDSIDDCVCTSGAARLGTPESPVCVDCGPGTFSDPANNGECANCSLGTFTTGYGATVCDVCPDNSSSYFIPRTACQCDKGFKCASGAASCDDGACVQCEANTYRDVGGAAACTLQATSGRRLLQSCSRRVSAAGGGNGRRRAWRARGESTPTSLIRKRALCARTNCHIRILHQANFRTTSKAPAPPALFALRDRFSTPRGAAVASMGPQTSRARRALTLGLSLVLKLTQRLPHTRRPTRASSCCVTPVSP